MSHFAKIENNLVTKVIVAEQDFIDTLGGTWVRTSYNTIRGEHLEGKTPLRFNFAGIGYSYDSERDAFIPPQNYPSWVLNETTCSWEAPVAEPEPVEGKYFVWDEENIKWKELTKENMNG